MSLYLTRADRLVIGADLTRASLLLGQGAAQRFGLTRVHSSKPICAVRDCELAHSMSSTRRASCTNTPNPRASLPASLRWRGPAGSS